jgi:hypothetical protein
VGLALLGDGRALPRIREIVKGARGSAETLREATLALGILGDAELWDTISPILRDGVNTPPQVWSTAATALGYARDAKSERVMLQSLTNVGSSAGMSSRILAASGIGAGCDPFLGPWTSSLSAGFNYAATATVLNDFASSAGILNRL